MEAPKEGDGGPRLGPWLLAMHQWNKGMEGASKLGKKTSYDHRPPVSSSQVSSGGDGWTKVQKVVWRRSLAHPVSGATGGGPHLVQNEGEGRPANPFSVLRGGLMEDDECYGPLAKAQPKRARQSDPDVGRATGKLVDKTKGPTKAKKGSPSSSRAKGKTIVQSEGGSEQGAEDGGPGVFLFSALNRGKKGMVEIHSVGGSEDSGVSGPESPMELGPPVQRGEIPMEMGG